jgi:hypothetical protein
MSKQSEFQKRNFNEFNNADLGSDLERIITNAESLYWNNESIAYGKSYDEVLDYPYEILVEDNSYFYAEEKERDEDLKTLSELISNYLFTEYCLKGLRAVFYNSEKKIELYKDDKLIHTENSVYEDDFWFGINIDGKHEVDFNFWKDTIMNEYVLNIYPIVTQNEDGFWKTDYDIFERVNFETI